uniref:Interleukin-12 subunit alpha n=1 Tax=Mastacembelus armatus TaxID=205130 RepID=A0A7N8XXZ0_9TELE
MGNILFWRTSTGVPVPALSAEKCASCSLLFKHLLLQITELLTKAENEVLCYGIPSDKVRVNNKTETLLACAPTLTQNSGCIQRDSSFSESDCLRNIMKDLVHHEAIIQSYIKASLRNPEKEVKLLMPVLGIIQDLRKVCLLCLCRRNKNTERQKHSHDLKEGAAHVWGNSTYENRLDMCKMMRGFHIRTITINRAMGYISSGDHKK